MRILLDESLPRKLVRELVGHETETVLVAVDNRIETLRPLVPRVLEALQGISAGQLVRVCAEST